MAHISRTLQTDKFIYDNGEMQALVNAADEELRRGSGAGSDFS